MSEIDRFIPVSPDFKYLRFYLGEEYRYPLNMVVFKTAVSSEDFIELRDKIAYSILNKEEENEMLDFINTSTEINQNKKRLFLKACLIELLILR